MKYDLWNPTPIFEDYCQSTYQTMQLKILFYKLLFLQSVSLLDIYSNILLLICMTYMLDKMVDCTPAMRGKTSLNSK